MKTKKYMVSDNSGIVHGSDMTLDRAEFILAATIDVLGIEQASELELEIIEQGEEDEETNESKYIDLIDRGLTTLMGQDIPQKVGGYFDCSYNELTALEGAPEYVGCFSDLSYNKLTSLEGSPREVGWSFDCSNNKLTSLEGSPQKVGGGFFCPYNKLTSLEGSPQKVGETFNCANNELTSLAGAPEYVGGDFYCHRNSKKFTEEEVRAVCKVKGRIIV